MASIDWRQARRDALLGLAFWGTVALFFYSRSWLQFSTQVRPTAYGWGDVWLSALVDAAVGVAIWAVLTALILDLARRVPLRGRHRGRNLAFHAAGCIVLASASTVLSFWVATFTYKDGPFWPRFYFVNIHSSIAGYVVVVAAGHAFEVYRRYRDRELAASRLETQLTRANLRALEMQVQPHFLFNTLNAISELVHHDPEAAELMIAQLGDLLRMTTDGAPRPEVPLSRELAFVGTYLEIERTRFQDRLSIRTQVDDDVLDCLVPNLVLHPLVENAVRHGLSPRVAPGTLTITARRLDGLVRITVRDDGRGLPPPEQRRERVGIGNTRLRLRQTYGDAHRFELADAPGGGTVVMIEIPYRAADAEPLPEPPRPLSPALTLT
jgi:two-component system LytT family sensor kinase